MAPRIRIVAVAFWLMALSGLQAHAQYVATQLPIPTGQNAATVFSVSEGQPVGMSALAYGHAVLWNNVSGSLLDLDPGAFGSVAYAADKGTQAGANIVLTYTTHGSGRGGGSHTWFIYHATLWHGSASSNIDIHPANMYISQVLALRGNSQVGWASASLYGEDHAYLWHGTAASAIDLTPSGYLSAQANAVDGGIQVGSGYSSTSYAFPHALLWKGTAASSIDLQPTDNAITASVATAVDATANREAGFVNLGAYYPTTLHAYLWSGTAASGVDLNPTGFDSSQITAIRGKSQVGYGTPTGLYETHALVWNGTAASATDLHSFLPAGYLSSHAQAIDADGNIVGYASDGRNNVPFLWRPKGVATLTTTQTPLPTASGWSPQSVTVSLTSPFTGTAASLSYRINGSATIKVSGTAKNLSFPNSGTYFIEAYGTDGKRAQTPVQAYTANIDVLPPKSTLAYTNFTVTLAATDAQSGVATTFFILDGGTQTSYRAPVPLTNIPHTVEYWSTDRAGNVEAHHAATLSAVAPTLLTISPNTTLSGSPALTLTLTGSGFLNSSTVNWNGSARTTTFVNASTLQAAILASDLVAAGTASVTVTNASPGKGTSTPVKFTIQQTCTVTGSVTSVPETGTAGFGIGQITAHSGFTLNGNALQVSTPAGTTFLDAKGNIIPILSFYENLEAEQRVSVIGTYNAATNTLTAQTVRLQ